MKTKQQHKENGQILMLLALGLVALLAFVALALDSGQIFLDRRRAQNAADAAALAGAYQLARDPWTNTVVNPLATRITSAVNNSASANQYGTANGKILVNTFPPDASKIHFIAGDTDINHYVRVVITSAVNTSFLQFVFNGPILNTVEAVAHTVPPTHGNPWFGNGIVALDPVGCSTFNAGGNSTAFIPNGSVLVASSTANCAADGGGSSALIVSGITSGGGISGSLSANVTLVPPGALVQNDLNARLAYPPSIGIGAPPTCATAAAKVGTNNKTVNGVTYDEWSPGSMNGWPSGNIYFDPGIYCVSINGGGGANINNNQHYYNDPNDGTRVLFVITGNDPCNMTVNGGATLQLKGYGLDPWKGLLFYFDPRDFSKAAPTGEPSLILNGTQDSYINGTLYAPTCAIRMNGTGGNFYQGQIIGYDVNLIGNNQINMFFIDDDNWEQQLPAKVDLNQ